MFGNYFNKAATNYPSIYNCYISYTHNYALFHDLESYTIPEFNIMVATDIKCNIHYRKNVRNMLYILKKSYKDVIEDPSIINLSKRYMPNIVRDQTILVELPEKIEQLRLKRYENRLDIGKVLLRKNIPADLLPLICSYTVPGTKLYNYM